MKKPLLLFLSFLVFFSALAPLSAALSEPKAANIKVLCGENIKIFGAEDYILHVMAAQDVSGLGDEALKAFAVAVRTAVYRVITGGGRHKDHDFCDSADCCFPLSDNITDRITEAVLSTSGEIIVDPTGAPAEASFCVCGGERDCLHKLNKHFSAEDMADLIGIGIKDTEKGMIIYSAAGEADTVIFGGKKYDAAEICKKLSLPSKKFYIEKAESGFDVTVKGIGEPNGLDLCALSDNSADYTEMTEKYFPGTKLQNIYEN